MLETAAIIKKAIPTKTVEPINFLPLMACFSVNLHILSQFFIQPPVFS
jgi:hypothetical protein